MLPGTPFKVLFFLKAVLKCRWLLEHENLSKVGKYTGNASILQVISGFWAENMGPCAIYILKWLRKKYDLLCISTQPSLQSHSSNCLPWHLPIFWESCGRWIWSHWKMNYDIRAKKKSMEVHEWLKVGLLRSILVHSVREIDFSVNFLILRADDVFPGTMMRRRMQSGVNMTKIWQDQKWHGPLYFLTL